MEPMQPCDSTLVSLYLAGQESAFGLLLERHRGRVFTTILLIVRDEDVAEDLVQDAFIKAIHVLKGGRYNDENKFGPWLCRIGHNLAIDAFRRGKRAPHTSLSADDSALRNTLAYAELPADDTLVREETHAALRRLIQELPAAQKEVLLMRHYGDLSFQEIADATGVSINTALGRMRYALINLRKKMSVNPRLYDTTTTALHAAPLRVQRIAG